MNSMTLMPNRSRDRVCLCTGCKSPDVSDDPQCSCHVVSPLCLGEPDGLIDSEQCHSNNLLRTQSYHTSATHCDNY
jgi:hypothetical protein